MKYQRTPRFETDYRALKPEHRRAFADVITDFAAACDAYATDPAHCTWPRALCVSPLKSAPGIREMTWSFASTSGRATFQFIRLDGLLALRWRRIGYHSIYRAS